jgi:hypothetical protein
MRLDAGVPVHFQIDKGRQTRAHVVECQPIGSNEGWRVGARLDRPENCWGLKSCPEDWAELPQLSTPGGEQPATALTALSKSVPLKVQLLRAQVRELLEPLQSEVAILKDRLERYDNRAATRNRFEVSLSHVPPEVEEKLWVRLSQELKTQVQQQTREEASHLLEAAQDAIRQKLLETQEEFRHCAAEQLQLLEHRTREFSEEIGSYMQDRVRAEIDEIRQQAEDAATRLEQQGGELLQSLQDSLAQEHATHLELKQRVQIEVEAQSDHLQTQIHELSNRAARELRNQLEDSCGRLQDERKCIETAVSQSLAQQVSQMKDNFEHSIEDLTQEAVERWRLALARNLDSIAKTLAVPFRDQATPDQHPDR